MILIAIGWLALFVGALIIGFVSEYESDSWVGWLILSGLILWGGGALLHLQPLVWLKANAASMPAWVSEYITTGIVWSITKFFFRARTTETREALASAKICTRPRLGRSEAEWERETAEVVREARHKVFMSIFKHTPGWIAFWPVSMLVTLVKDWFRSIFTFLADCFKGVYKKIFEVVTGEKL